MRILKRILEGNDIRQVISEASEYGTQSKNLRSALASFPKKCSELWDSLGDVHDMAVNLKKYGRDYVDEYDKGALDREFGDWFIEQAKTLQDYYNNRISPRIDKWLKDNNLTEKELYEDFPLGQILKDDLAMLQQICAIDLNTIDLDQLKIMF